MDKPIEDILEKWCLNDNPKHIRSIHESPKDKNASTHQPQQEPNQSTKLIKEMFQLLNFYLTLYIKSNRIEILIRLLLKLLSCILSASKYYVENDDLKR